MEFIELREKLQKVDEESERKSIKEVKTGRVFSFGENTYYDMLIESYVLCDMFPEIAGSEPVKGGNKNNYILI